MDYNKRTMLAFQLIKKLIANKKDRQTIHYCIMDQFGFGPKWCDKRIEMIEYQIEQNKEATE